MIELVRCDAQRTVGWIQRKNDWLLVFRSPYVLFIAEGAPPMAMCVYFCLEVIILACMCARVA